MMRGTGERVYFVKMEHYGEWMRTDNRLQCSFAVVPSFADAEKLKVMLEDWMPFKVVYTRYEPRARKWEVARTETASMTIERQLEKRGCAQISIPLENEN